MIWFSLAPEQKRILGWSAEVSVILHKARNSLVFGDTLQVLQTHQLTAHLIWTWTFKNTLLITTQKQNASLK